MINIHVHFIHFSSVTSTVSAHILITAHVHVLYTVDGRHYEIIQKFFKDLKGEVKFTKGDKCLPPPTLKAVLLTFNSIVVVCAFTIISSLCAPGATLGSLSSIFYSDF